MDAYAEVALNLPVDRTFTYRIPEELRERTRAGVRVTVPFRSRDEKGYVVRTAPTASFPRLRDVVEADAEVTADAKLLDLARWVADRYGCSWGEAISAAIPSGVKKARPGRKVRLVSAGEGEGKTERQKAAAAFACSLRAPLPFREFLQRAGAGAGLVNGLIRAGVLKETLVEPEIDALADAIVEPPKDIRPTPEQEEALADIARGGEVLLHGVTGSGKTEVYLRAIARVVEAGRQAIVLVPEIALTPQTVARFKARFPRVAVLHSVLTEAARAAQWRTIRSGAVDVVVGARSAVFAPVPALGLVVLDEEHEGAYKQENAPRYHAREVAAERCRREGATLVLGTATPSLESLQRARDGGLRLARLPSRVAGQGLPEIEIVDMAAERAELKRQPLLSRRLEDLLRQALSRREQAILFLNRRGFLTHVSCGRCGWFFSCRRCDVAMTFHKETGRAVCHHCCDARPLPTTCPECQAGTLRQYGTGTERIETELKRLFPEYRVARMDSDSMKTRRDYRDSLGAFWAGKTDILVGTQMIAKGLDVPDVTLVGVVSADTAFHVPDFRAAERTFQLITQVAGRAGRGPKGGRVVVQTFFPNHYAVKMSATYDFAGFVEKELEMRREDRYPPFSTLVRVLVQGWNAERVKEAAGRIGAKLRALFGPLEAEVLGPAEAPYYKLKNRFRVQLLVKLFGREAALGPLRKLAEGFPNTRALQATLDVDPLSLQ